MSDIQLRRQLRSGLNRSGRRLLSRLLAFSGLAALLVPGYVALVGGLGRGLPPVAEWLLTVAVTGLFVVLFDPCRRLLQARLDAWLGVEKDDPLAILADLSARLATARPPEALLTDAVRTIARCLSVDYAAVLLPESEPVTFGRLDDRPGPLLAWPLLYGGRRVGQLVVAERAADLPFGRGEERLLAEIAHQLAAAVEALNLQRHLQQARAQLVWQREEERRHVRRLLHDSLGGRLGSLILGVDAARSNLRLEQTVARSQVHQLKLETRAALQAVRGLARELGPAGESRGSAP